MVKEDLYPAMPNEDYHGDHDSYSKSNLSDFSKSPKYMVYKRTHPETKKEWDLGTATHTFLLQPELWKKEIVIMPPEIKTRRGKAWTEFKDAHPGQTIITQAQAADVNAMATAIMMHPVAEEHMTGGMPEVSLFSKVYFELEYYKGSAVPLFKFSDFSFTPPDLPAEYVHSLMLKCRPDMMHEGIIVDLKTAIDITPDGFGRAAFNFKYHWSAFLTKMLLERYLGASMEYIFVVVEKKPPYDVAVYKCPDDIIDMAEDQVVRVLQDLARCDFLKEFPGIKQQVHVLEFPRWAYTQHDQDMWKDEVF